MTVLNAFGGRVKPGRFEDHLAMGAEAVKLMDRLGAQHPRLAMAVATGGPADAFIFSTEHENGEAWGEFYDAITADLEFQAFMGRARAESGPSTIGSSTLSYEIPLRANNPARGNVVEVHVGRPVRGGFVRGLEDAARVLELVEDRGATNARLFEVGYAGANSRLLMLSWEHESMKAHGRLSDLWSTDPDLVEIAMISRFGTDPTSITVWDGLYQIVPM